MRGFSVEVDEMRMEVSELYNSYALESVSIDGLRLNIDWKEFAVEGPQSNTGFPVKWPWMEEEIPEIWVHSANVGITHPFLKEKLSVQFGTTYDNELLHLKASFANAAHEYISLENADFLFTTTTQDTADVLLDVHIGSLITPSLTIPLRIESTVKLTKDGPRVDSKVYSDWIDMTGVEFDFSSLVIDTDLHFESGEIKPLANLHYSEQSKVSLNIQYRDCAFQSYGYGVSVSGVSGQVDSLYSIDESTLAGSIGFDTLSYDEIAINQCIVKVKSNNILSDRAHVEGTVEIGSVTYGEFTTGGGSATFLLDLAYPELQTFKSSMTLDTFSIAGVEIESSVITVNAEQPFNNWSVDIKSKIGGGEINATVLHEISKDAGPSTLVEAQFKSISTIDLLALYPEFQGELVGSISGDLKFRYVNETVELIGGYLALDSDTEANLRYTEKAWLTEGLEEGTSEYFQRALAEQALRDFIISKFSMEILEEPEEGDPAAVITLSGISANDLALGSQVFKPVPLGGLTVNIHGELNELIRNLIKGGGNLSFE